MELLFIIGLGIVVYWIFGRNSNNSANKFDEPLLQRNREWVQFILNYRPLAKSKDQKELLNKMLSDLAAQGQPMPDDINIEAQPIATASVAASQVTATDQVSEEIPATPTIDIAQDYQPIDASKDKAQIQLDNASLLLYLGAFLFVASAGLFVVFSGIPGELRCLIVLLTALIMYGGGIWLHKNSSKMQQAGLAFAGIGIAIAPLVGLAAYKYVFDQSNGATVWFGTSVLCLVMYTHALFALRNSLMNYVFILTFLSLFESGISMIDAPIYYFGWMLAGIGLLLTAISRYKGFWPEMQESTRLSAQAFLPLSVLVAVVMVPTQGAGQLGVSLLLAAAFYAMETLASEGETKQFNALVTQTSIIAGISSITYSINESWINVAIVLSVLSIVQAIIILIISRTNVLAVNFASITMASALLAIIAGIGEPPIVLGTSIIMALLSAVVWVRQKRIDGYVVSAIALMATPIIYGQYFSDPPINSSIQSLIILAALAAQLIVLLIRKVNFNQAEQNIVQLTYLFSSLVVILSSCWARPELALGISTVIALSMLVISKRQNETDWALASGLFIAAPLFWTWNSPGVFLATVSLALLMNIYLALAYRKDFNRWLGTVIWLMLPLALANINLFTDWNSTTYAWAYLVAMVGLIIARAIARGVILISSKVPMASYARTASISYVAGYVFASVIAVYLSVIGGKDMQTTFILSFLTIAAWVLSKFIEKQPEILIFIPLLLQSVLLSAVHPQAGADSMMVFTLASTALALLSYFVSLLVSSNKESSLAITSGSLIAVFVTPLAVLFVDNTIWPMPFGLIIAALLVLFHVWKTKQEYRELAGGLVVAGIFWMMYFLEVTNYQAYSHTLVALFALYAYWRNSRGEIQESDNYLYAMLATATIPLGLQALSGASGGLYGWWLIIEQIFFMVLGMSIGKRFVTMWGLYVAVGAVLYQLRGLGWAALTVLAIFIIGLAIYKIQKYTDKH